MLYGTGGENRLYATRLGGNTLRRDYGGQLAVATAHVEMFAPMIGPWHLPDRWSELRGGMQRPDLRNGAHCQLSGQSL